MRFIVLKLECGILPLFVRARVPMAPIRRDLFEGVGSYSFQLAVGWFKVSGSKFKSSKFKS
jgi:hypothetical protein